MNHPARSPACRICFSSSLSTHTIYRWDSTIATAAAKRHLIGTWTDGATERHALRNASPAIMVLVVHQERPLYPHVNAPACCCETRTVLRVTGDLACERQVLAARKLLAVLRSQARRLQGSTTHELGEVSNSRHSVLEF